MSAADTRREILEVALELFSRSGFDAVSIRDICARVGIKESTVYYHFENKRAILEELRLRFEQTAGDLMRTLDAALREPLPREGVSMSAVSDIFFERYLMDDFCNGFMRLMDRERGQDADMRRLYEQWMFDEPLGYQASVFGALMRAGVLPQGDCAHLALKYYAPIFLICQRHLMGGPPGEAEKARFREAVGLHIGRFFRESIGG
ncbi:MAG TPA: TetR/AcrR family transcriptional regulator [Clostridia bacterium]|nr:TetR/AcrR family transcriptional regulator [Clostridia bacterium]